MNVLKPQSQWAVEASSSQSGVCEIKRSFEGGIDVSLRFSNQDNVIASFFFDKSVFKNQSTYQTNLYVDVLYQTSMLSTPLSPKQL